MAVSPSGIEKYTIRRATLLDVRALHRLERVIFPRDAYPYPDLFLMFVMPGIVNLKAVAPDRSLAGFVAGIRGGMHRDRSWIITIGVDPAHQRRGLGAQMLHVMEQRLGRPAMRLTVREGNHPAIRLYQKTGYTVVERRAGYYPDGEAGLIMEKPVDLSSG
ncbi:MAG: GNAT family N-acetyltransferase [Anaerolineae bacterium]|nr:GNAT family N-acetyltransferase [Anaerolineae bacterium]